MIFAAGNPSFIKFKIAQERPVGNKRTDKDSGFPVKMCLQLLRMLRLKHTLMKNEIMNTGLSSLKDASPERGLLSWALK